MNADWHRAHVLGRGASWDDRVAWHAEHVRACSCRRPPPDIQAEIDRRSAAGAPSSTDGTDGRTLEP